MTETPDEWLEKLFEFEYCAECGGDAEDHEVCIVPGIGTYFARCMVPGRAEPASLVLDHYGGRGEPPVTPTHRRP